MRDKRGTENYVRRHIELTAVPMRIGTNRIRVMESIDSKRTTRGSIDYIILKYTMKSLILAQDER